MVMVQEKKGGPYTKDEKRERRDEVHRLHIEYCFSARKISKMMNICRDTINADIDYWYSELASTNVIDPEFSILVGIERFNAQRSKLYEERDKAENFKQKQALDKMIFDIGCKIIDTQMKLANSKKRIHDEGVEQLNTWLKDNGKDKRYLTYSDVISASTKVRNKIVDLIVEDRMKPKVNEICS